jgi:hypothetical protein
VARPLKYKTVEEMQEAIDAYFNGCKGEVLRDADEVPVLSRGLPVMIGERPPTVTGLALALGFNSRQALLNYQAKREFNDTVTRAKTRCEDYAESRLFDRDGAMGAKFSLTNNFKGWKDKQTDDGADEELLEKAKEMLGGVPSAF